MSNHPETKATLEVCMFGGASSLPILAAAELGIFEAAGLDVNIHLTRGSAELMEGLLDGTYDIVRWPTTENPIEYNFSLTAAVAGL